MGEPKVGDAFIRHEFDEAIAIHGGIVQAETKRIGDLAQEPGAPGRVAVPAVRPPRLPRPRPKKKLILL